MNPINQGNFTNATILDRELTNEEKEQFKKKRLTGLRKLGSCSVLTAIVSVLSIGIGIGCIAAFAEEGKLPYTVGAALISGCTSLLAATLGILASREGLEQERRSSEFHIDAGFGVKCKIIASYIFTVLNFTIVGFSTATGIIGIILCSSDDSNCDQDSDAKIALSVLTLIVGVVLFVFALFLAIWFCVYARVFGFQGRNNGRMRLQMMRMQRQLEKQQQQLDQQQQQIQQQQGQGYSNYSYK